MASWRKAAIFLLAGCAGQPEGALPASPAPAPSLFDPLAYDVPEAPRLSLQMHDGLSSQVLLRQGPAAVHLLARGGERPRVIAAFPAGDAGIGVWFRPAPADTELSWSSDAPDEPIAITREGGERSLHGARAILRSTAERLSSELALLGSARTLRDYGQGECLEDAERYAPLRNESFELDPQHAGLRIRRVEIGGAHSLELLLAGLDGTTINLRRRADSPRSGCPQGETGGQPVIEIEREGGIALSIAALVSDDPLTPLEPEELLKQPRGGDEVSALAFLSYHEKLLAGSWRFLTYFGRDTLLSLWMLLPAVTPAAAADALASVLERVQLDASSRAPDGSTIERGDVAHEEEIGDYAAWKNQALSPPPRDVRAPRYDYKMIDDDFLLAPLLEALASQPGAPALDAWLGERRADGRSFEEAALANLELVLRRARPFADDPRPPAEKKALLVGLREGLSVGQWRDSEMGLGFGRYPFDVNAALVPAALAAARALYTRLGRVTEAAEAGRLAAAWQGIEQLFRFEIPLATARANVSSYAASVGLADTSGTLADDGGERVVEYALALDAARAPIPIQHSDHAFVLAFGAPSDSYLRHVAELLVRPFPAGLMSSVGVMVANPALSAPDATVIDPRQPDDPNDDVRTSLRDLFTATSYHGTVVWSWQQALLAAGLRRQLLRADLAAATRSALSAAECSLWSAIDATRGQGSGELWSWAAREGRPELRPFGADTADADESNAVQLWSTVYLAVEKPDTACPPAPAAAAQ